MEKDQRSDKRVSEQQFKGAFKRALAEYIIDSAIESACIELEQEEPLGEKAN